MASIFPAVREKSTRQRARCEYGGMFEPGDVERGSARWRRCQRFGLRPPSRARSGPVRLEPHWNG